MRRSFVTAAAAVLVLTGLSGCSDGKADVLSDAERAAQEVDVTATAQTGIIRGIVVDSAIAPIGNATVRIASVNRTTASNDDGAFGFEDLPPGEYFLEASRDGYTSVQGHATVVAGEQDPDIVKLQLQALPRGEPYIVPQQYTLFMDGSFAVAGSTLTLGGFTGQGSFGLVFDLAEDCTVVQAEHRWDPTSPAAGEFNVYGGTYTSGDDRVHYQSVSSGSPLVGRWNATDGNETADRLSTVIRVAPTELNVAYNQPVEVYVHAFYNFRPGADWQFGRDGEHPIPPP